MNGQAPSTDHLAIYKGQQFLGTYALTQDIVTLGRDPTCVLAIDDDKSSRLHSQITHKEGLFYIADMGSTNGTFLNGKRLHPAKKEFSLSHQDVITIGEHTFQCQFPSLLAKQKKSPVGATVVDTNLGARMGKTRDIRAFDEALLTEEKEEALSPEDQQKLAQAAARLVVTGGPAPGVYPLQQQKVTIGREAGNAMTLPDDSLSGNHAQICFSKGRFYIEDLGSTNGTLVNGTLIKHQHLENGFSVTIGDLHCVFECSLPHPGNIFVDDKSLSDAMLASGKLSGQQVQWAIGERRNTGRGYGEILCFSGVMTADDYSDVYRNALNKIKFAPKKKSRLPMILGVAVGGIVVVTLCLWIFVFADWEAKKLRNEAVAFAEAGQLKEAETAYQDAIKAVRSLSLKKEWQLELADIHMQMAKEFQKAGKEDKALDKLAANLRFLQPHDKEYKATAELQAEILFSMAMKAEAQKREAKVKTLLEQIIDLDILKDTKNEYYEKAGEELAKHYYREGLNNYKDGRTRDALDTWKQALEVTHTDARIWKETKAALLYNEARFLFDQADIIEAKGILGRFFDILPEKDLKKTHFYEDALDLQEQISKE
jgi:pSer/pThr/pTyr-binding forkhead associated (FHA) protein